MKLNKSGKASLAHWHPNFRVEGKLPDTKVIRTAFLINAVAVTVLLVAAFFLVSRERELNDVRASIGSAAEGGLNKDIADNQPRLAQAQKLQGSFSATEKKVREIEAFVTPTLVASDFLGQIAKTLPRLTMINTIDYRGESVKLRGTLIGASERATILAKDYVEQLKRDPVLATWVARVELNNLDREQASGRLTFEIELKLKPRK